MTEYDNRGIPAGQLKKSDWWLIGSAWLVTQILLVMYLGINSRQESLKYIGLAESWVSGHHRFIWNEVFYSGYVAIHVLLHLVGLPPEAMYIIQLIFSGIAVIYFVKIICLYVRWRPAIVLSAILFSTCFLIQQWVCALFTDSIFGSLLIIAAYYLLTKHESSRNKLICRLLLVLLPFFRPVGFLFIVLACIYWLCDSKKNHTKELVFFFIYLMLTGVIIYKSLVDNPAYFYPNHNTEANIICGYPGNLLKYQKIPYRAGMNMFTYIGENPGMFLRLYVYRFIKVFSMSRDYFSTLHNVLLAVSCSFYLILAFIGSFSRTPGFKKILILALTGIFLFSLPSVLFCVEWSGRFSLPVYCFILILGGFGVNRIRELTHSSSS